MYDLKIICQEGNSDGRQALNEEIEGVGSYKPAQPASRTTSMTFSSPGLSFLVASHGWRI